MKKENSKQGPEITLGGSLSPEQVICRLDVVFGEAYKNVVELLEENTVLNELCEGMADALGLGYIWVGKVGAENVLTTVAASGMGALHREYLRVPEHYDDSALGNGPAARALRNQKPALIKVEDEGFQPWRKAAEKDGIKALLSVPMPITRGEQTQDWAVIFADAKFRPLQHAGNQAVMRSCVIRMASVCNALHLMQRLRLVNAAMESAGNAAFITDTEGTILWANASFGRLTGHEHQAVIGRNPRILKSGKQGYRYYSRLWRTISSGKVWTGETVDRDSQGELYTIRQTVSPILTNGKISHYISINDDISDEKRMQQARDRARRIDELTGLMTTGLFTERYERAVSRAVSNKEPLALLLLTINDFETLMLSLGRDIEELVLETLGDRIRSYLQEDDFAANLSNGDFAIVLTSVSSSEAARQLGEEILEVLNEPFPLLGDKLYLSRGLGVAFVPDDSQEADELMRIADARAGGKD